jgi:membrane protein implicated in regulation of membrane protease activity
MTQADNQVSPGQRFAGGCLLAAGALIATLCGACTLWLTIVVILAGLTIHGSLSAAVLGLGVTLVVGGLPTVVGVTLVAVGWRMIRPRRPPPRELNDTFS